MIYDIIILEDKGTKELPYLVSYNVCISYILIKEASSFIVSSDITIIL